MNPRPTRVLHVVFSLDAGGMENGVINLANQLDGRCELHVACLDHAGVMAPRLAHPERVHVLGKPAGFSIHGVKELGRCIRGVQPDIIHTHNLGPLIYGALATRWGRTAPILHGEHSQFSAADITPKRLFQRRLFTRATTAVHTVSHGLSEELRAYRLDGPSLHTLINGVDTTRFAPRSGHILRQTWRLSGDDLVIGMVGRFGPFKRHDLLIAAFEELHTENPAAHLVIVGGGGPEEGRIRQRCRESRASRAIHLTGFSPIPEEVYPAFDLLVVPSINEGLSNVVLESMASGVPVLSHHSCGSAEVIQSGMDSVVADLSTPERLTAELRRLITGPEQLRAMGIRARETITQRFSISRMTDRYAELYAQLRRG